MIVVEWLAYPKLRPNLGPLLSPADHDFTILQPEHRGVCESGLPEHLQVPGERERLIPVCRFKLGQKLTCGRGITEPGINRAAAMENAVNPELLNAFLDDRAFIAHDVGIDEPSCRFQESECLPEDFTLFVWIEMMERI